MTASRDPDRLIHAFFDEGLDDLPDPVYDAVRDRIETTRQRAFFGSWRTADMNRYLKWGLAAAAVVVIAVVAINLLPGSPAPGGAPTATPEPSVAEPTPEPSTAAGLPLGPHVLLDGGVDDFGTDTVKVTVTISAPGWDGDPGGGLLIKGSGDPPDTAATINWGGVDHMYVFGDPCNWSETRPETPATTVDEVMAALAAQASREASAPVDITLDGYKGKAITLHVPDDAAFSGGEFTECDLGYFGSWSFGTTDLSPHRYHQGPGQIDEVWVLDVDGLMVILDWSHYAGTPQANVDELEAIIQSATFEQ